MLLIGFYGEEIDEENVIIIYEHMQASNFVYSFFKRLQMTGANIYKLVCSDSWT